MGKKIDKVNKQLNKINDVVASLIRTYFVLGVGFLLAWAARHGLEVHVSQAWLALASSVVYGGAVRFMEHYVDPRVGWLLGLARVPKYTSKAVLDTPDD